MKIPRLERLARLQREYHRANPWRLSQGGLYITHSYSNMAPDDRSYWDDVGFNLNGRRIIVWWQHPRFLYANAIEDMTSTEVGEGPTDDWLFEGGTKNYKLVGRSRKKLVSYTCREPSSAQREHYDSLRQATARLSNEGVDLT